MVPGAAPVALVWTTHTFHAHSHIYGVPAGSAMLSPCRAATSEPVTRIYYGSGRDALSGCSPFADVFYGGR